MATILICPDTHAPFMHPKALQFLKELKKEYRPKVVIHLGDEVDAHALSQWGSDPEGLSAGDELKKAIEQLKGLQSLFPKLYLCESNHGKRPFRKAFQAGIPSAYLREYQDFLKAPRTWVWKDSWEFDGVIYQHGEGYTGKDGALKAALTNRKSTVIGHIHAWGGVQYSATKKDQIFGMNSGCLIDDEAYAFKYAKTYPHKATLGASVVIDGCEARFIPL